MNKLQVKYPEKYDKYSKIYDISKTITREEYIERNIKRDKNSLILLLFTVLIVYFIFILFVIYLVNIYNISRSNSNLLINTISEKVCQDKNMSYYKFEYDQENIYLNCNKEVIIIKKHGR